MGSRLPLELTSPTPEAMSALWGALCDDPMFDDLPYKVETNERGQLLMSPASTPHSFLQAEIACLLRLALGSVGLDGKVLFEAALLTPQGIKVPDVAWISDIAWSNRENQVLLTHPGGGHLCRGDVAVENRRGNAREDRALSCLRRG